MDTSKIMSRCNTLFQKEDDKYPSRHICKKHVCPFSLDENKNYSPQKEIQITITDCFYNKIFDIHVH
jgi:hypothetical protein